MKEAVSFCKWGGFFVLFKHELKMNLISMHQIFETYKFFIFL